MLFSAKTSAPYVVYFFPWLKKVTKMLTLTGAVLIWTFSDHGDEENFLSSLRASQEFRRVKSKKFIPKTEMRYNRGKTWVFQWAFQGRTLSHHPFLLVPAMLLFGFLNTIGADFISASVTVLMPHGINGLIQCFMFIITSHTSLRQLCTDKSSSITHYDICQIIIRAETLFIP